MPLSAPTDLAPPFAWDGDHVAVDLGAGARGLFTTRRGGASEGPYASLNLGRWTDDNLAAIEANWRRLWSLTGERRLLVGRQVHGATVARLRRDDDERPPDADGQATSNRGSAVMVLTADCLPVLLAAGGAVAAVHAGWRGLAAGVLEEGVAALRDVGGRGAVTAAIGPAACGRCYEVRDDVREALGEPPVGGPAPIDLKQIARRRLEATKVTVHDVGLCTMCSPRDLFFSHRADGGVTGRQAGVAWLA